VVQAILQGGRRILLTMATGTGKTVVAFQPCFRRFSIGRSRGSCRADPNSKKKQFVSRYLVTYN